MKIKNKNKIKSLLLALFLIVMMVVPAMGAGQPTVVLGTTSTFAVFAGSTITNTGTTTINGDAGADIGIYPGNVLTGQASLVTGGAIHLADEIAIAAKGDLITAYDNVVERTPVTRIATELGGATLKPGIYDSEDGTFKITGTLTLDGNDELNPVFMFKTESTLITESDSNVNLINGARYCRTFWQAGSSATLGTNSHFEGHLLAYTSIAVNTGATVQGKLLARTGAVTLDNNTITNGICTIASTTTDDEQDIDTTPKVDTTPEVITPTEVVKTTVTGGELPNTATPWYNILLLGFALIIAGAVSWSIRSRYE